MLEFELTSEAMDEVPKAPDFARFTDNCWENNDDAPVASSALEAADENGAESPIETKGLAGAKAVNGAACSG